MIFASEEYANVVSEIVVELQETVAAFDLLNIQESAIRNDVSGQSFNSVSLSSISSSLHQDDVREILQQIQPVNPKYVRMEAMSRITKISISDLIADEFWMITSRLMELSLNDCDLR